VLVNSPKVVHQGYGQWRSQCKSSNRLLIWGEIAGKVGPALPQMEYIR